MSIVVDVLVSDEVWIRHNPDMESYLRDLVLKIIPQTKFAKRLNEDSEVEISLLLTNVTEIRELNKTYRNKDKETNVLSFPAVDILEMEDCSAIADFMAIGDVALSFLTIKSEAEEQNKVFNSHLTHLLVHGILHLLGYDHEKEEDACVMEALEVKILKKLEIDNPYIIN